MDHIFKQLETILPDGFEIMSFLKLALVLTIGSLIFAVIGRIAFGKKSTLNQSVSSAIGILFIYIATILIHSFGLNLNFLLSPLPFFNIYVTDAAGDVAQFYIPIDDYVSLCGELLNMVILAFLSNLVNSWIPQGKKLFGWLFFRIISVALAMVMFAIVNHLFKSFLPEGLITWAPVILLGLLVIMLLVGALKGLVGLALASVNPLIGFLYTFFFATIVGKMLTKAMLTTLLIAGLVYALNHFGVVLISIGTGVLIAYLPLLIILVIIWFIVGKLL